MFVATQDVIYNDIAEVSLVADGLLLLAGSLVDHNFFSFLVAGEGGKGGLCGDMEEGLWVSPLLLTTPSPSLYMNTCTCTPLPYPRTHTHTHTHTHALQRKHCE